jgi:opacity protein-like surface antigen
MLLMVAAAMMVALSVHAQHEEGETSIQPRVGVTFSDLTGEDDTKMKVSLTYGIEMEYYVSDNFSLAGGFLYTNQGTKFSSSDDKLNNFYFAVPLTANYYVLPGFAIKAGLQPAYRVKTNMKVDGKTIDLDRTVDYLSTYYQDNDIKISKFDLSIPVGLSYEFANITLDARYNFGLTKLFLNVDDNTRNRMIVVTLGYKL